MLALTDAYTPWIHLAAAHPRGPWAIVDRVLAHYLLVVAYDGEEELIVEGNSYRIPEGGSYLVQPGVLAEYIGSKSGNRPAYAHFDLIFNPHRDEHGNTLGSSPTLAGREHLLQPKAKEVWGVDLPLIVPNTLRPMMFKALDPIVRRWETGQPHEQLIANQELIALMHSWVSYEASKAGAPEWLDPDARIRRAEAQARARLSHGFGVDDFAKAAQMPRVRFSRLYQQRRGVTPGKALMEMRLSEAMRLLSHTKLSVQEIGIEVGYSNATVLGRLFRERHGVSPTEWRARFASRAG
ncbi:MAG: AraC family transcriptional regulator [Polyangiaceae bacterium]|nr:AraC family transcriptional regulator [Polyangiaceae bacterium]